jgi:carbamoyl-phosphate synthase large subunit
MIGRCNHLTEKIELMNILMTGVGGPTPRSFAHSLKFIGTQYRNAQLIATDTNRLAIGLYQNALFSHSYVIPRADDTAYWKVIEEIVEKHKIEAAVVLPELEVVEWSKRAQKGELPCKAFLPDPSINGILVDKAAMTEILMESGLVPPSVSFHRDSDKLQLIFDELGSDFWVRSSSGTSGLGSLRIDGLESLQNWIEINPGVQHFLASMFLPGRNLACKLLYWQGKLLRAACGERVNYIMAKVAPSGITGNTSFGRLLNEPELIDVAKKTMDLVFEYAKAPKHGFFTVDLKEDSAGRPFVTEINVRHVAFTQCFAAAGANFAEDSLRLLMGDPSFTMDFKIYAFEPGTIFLRDVDERPIIMKEEDLL